MSNVIPFPVLAGVEITTDAEGRFNLNALHRASGGEKKNGPSYWLALDSTTKLIEALKNQNTEIPVFAARGKNGGTFAHELLAVSYAGWISPAFQLKVNQVFIDYRTGKLQVPSLVKLTRLEILQMAMEAEQEKQRLAIELDAARPKVEALDRIATSDGGRCVTNAAKDLQVRPKDLFAWLSEHRWIYRRAGWSGWIAYQDKLQSGVLEHKVDTVERADGTEKTKERVLVTPKGLAKLAKLLGDSKAA